MDEELQKKMDMYNEMLLKSTALTFTSEGISKDIKSLLSKKAEFVSSMMTGLAALIEAASSSRKSTGKRQQMFDAMLEHALDESRTLNSTINYMLVRMFEKEACMVQSPEKQQRESAQSRKHRKNG